MPIPKEWLQYAPEPKKLTDGKEWNVFLSYRSVNRPWVLSLYDILTQVGHKVFLDQYVLKAGDKLISNLQDALEKSQAGVLIWSLATRDSVWVNDEYETLQRMANEDKDFIFVPVRLDDTKLPGFAANRVYVDFMAYPDGPNGGELLRVLSAIAGTALSGDAIRFANEQNEASTAATAQVRAAIKQGRPEKLVQLFEEGGVPWQTTSALGCMTAEGLIKLKKNDEAIVILEKLETSFKAALRPKQLKALAYARRGGDGDLDKAQDILGELHERNHLDPETMGIYARTFMDRYAKSNDINDLMQSRDLYVEAFTKAPDDYYTGINAAAKSVFIGTDKDLEAAAGYAAEVQKITKTEAVPGDYWKTATIAEVFLIQKKYKEAGDMYEKAVAMARNEKGSHESTFTQAKRLMEKLKPTDEERGMVEAAFQHLKV
jgi:tetratricopeptide (TPR) repeat protein